MRFLLFYVMRADGFGEVAARSEVDGVGSGVVDVVGGRRAPSFGIAVVGGVRDLRHVGLPWGGRRRSEESREEGRLRRLEAARYEKGPGSEICGPSEVVRTGLPSAGSNMRVSSVPALLPERPPAKGAEDGRRKHVESRFQFR